MYQILWVFFPKYNTCHTLCLERWACLNLGVLWVVYQTAPGCLLPSVSFLCLWCEIVSWLQHLRIKSFWKSGIFFFTSMEEPYVRTQDQSHGTKMPVFISHSMCYHCTYHHSDLECLNGMYSPSRETSSIALEIRNVYAIQSSIKVSFLPWSSWVCRLWWDSCIATNQNELCPSSPGIDNEKHQRRSTNQLKNVNKSKKKQMFEENK